MSAANALRWAVTREIPEMAEIDGLSFRHPWSAEDFRTHGAKLNVISMVYELSNKDVGYVVYTLNPKAVIVKRLAVHPDFRRQGIGQAILAQLIEKLKPDRRNRLVVWVDEYDLPCQLWLRSCGLRCEFAKNGELKFVRRVNSPLRNGVGDTP